MVAEPSRTAARILRALPRERITRLVGRVTQADFPQRFLRPVLAAYTRVYDVNLAEAVIPPTGFASFNDFFTRRLHPGVHTIDLDPTVAVSPADGRLDDDGPIDADQQFTVKGQPYDAAALLGSESDALGFARGHYAVVYLSPRDYHRVHTPLAGTVTHVRHIPGTLFPVNAVGVRHVPFLFARNERVVVHLATAHGPMAIVLVGAFIVGKISLAFDGPSRPPHGGPIAERRYPPGEGPVLARGAEVGAFLLGSTVVVLLPPGTRPWTRVSETVGRPVRMGQAMARRSEV